jgi:hypothetical protein
MTFFGRCGLVIVLGTLVACSSPRAAHPRPEPPAPAAANASANGAPAALASPPRFNAGRGEYDVVSTGTISAGGGGAPDTVRTDALVRFNAEWTSTGLDVTGTVVWRVSATGGVLAAGPAAPMSSASLDPVPFRAMVDTSRSAVRFASDSVTETRCPAPNAAALATVRELLSNVPRTLAPGSRWVDTLVTTTCRGEIPVTSTAIRSFAVTLERSLAVGEGEGEGADVVVTHTSTVDVRGRSSGAGQVVSITGTGTGKTSQRYTALTGRLLSATSVSDLDLTVGLAGRGSTLHQRAESTVRPTTAP